MSLIQLVNQKLWFFSEKIGIYLWDILFLRKTYVCVSFIHISFVVVVDVDDDVFFLFSASFQVLLTINWWVNFNLYYKNTNFIRDHQRWCWWWKQQRNEREKKNQKKLRTVKQWSLWMFWKFVCVCCRLFDLKFIECMKWWTRQHWDWRKNLELKMCNVCLR